MNLPESDHPSLKGLMVGKGELADRFISDGDILVKFEQLHLGSCFADLKKFRGLSVLILTARQYTAAVALLELDGVARRIVLAPTGLEPSYIGQVLVDGSVDVILTDYPLSNGYDNVEVVEFNGEVVLTEDEVVRSESTEWLLFTSGTTGRPKLVIHTLQSLIGPLQNQPPRSKSPVWGTFYDIRRYGGLQILLRAFVGGGSIVLSDPRESIRQFITRAGESGVSHISGTPSHWRGVLMSGGIGAFKPEYVRLSGEIADQAILDGLCVVFPEACISHAFASTEAGVGFEVRDGLEGFPAAWIGSDLGGVELLVVNGSLRIRSLRTGAGYAGAQLVTFAGPDDFVDTGDIVERRHDRYYFVGRREGIINVGGYKVYPEEVEAIVNLHPSVQMSRVQARSSPITGAIVTANVVVKIGADLHEGGFGKVRQEILQTCRERLPSYKVPALLYQVPHLDIAPSGKLLRRPHA